MTQSALVNSNEKKQEDTAKTSDSGLASPPSGLLARRLQEYRIRTNAKKMKITAGPAANMSGRPSTAAATLAEGTAVTDDSSLPPAAPEIDDEPVLMLSPLNSAAFRQNPFSRMLQIGGLFLSVFWVAICGFYIFDRYGFSQLSAMPPQELGAILTGVLAPVALLWVIVSAIRRGADAEFYAEALRGELQSLIFPTEERSRVVHRDIEALCRQAAELSASSKAVIKSIQRARLGLRTEIRDFVGLSKKTEFHIDRLADVLHEKNERLGTLTSDIAQRTAGIGEKTREGVEAWSGVTKTILEGADKMDAVLSKGTGKILSAAAQVTDKTREIDTHLEGSYKNLSVTVEKIAELESKTSGALESMSKSGQIVKDQCSALDQSVGNMERQAGKIAETISASLDTLNSTADNIIARTGALETRITGQADHLRQTVGTLAGEAKGLEEAGLAASSKLGEAMRAALTGAETVGIAVRRATESLDKSAVTARSQAESILESSRAHIERLSAMGTGNVEYVQSMASMLEQSRNQVEMASRLADLQVKKLSAAVEAQSAKITDATKDMVHRIESVNSSISDPLKAIAQAVADVDQKHEEIESTLRRRIADLGQSSDKARESAEHIRDILRGQAQEISALSGQIAGHSRSITEQMETQSGGLSERVRKALADIELVRSALDEQSGRLHSISESAISDVSRLEGEIGSRSIEIAGVTEKAVSGLSLLDDAVTEHVRTLKDRADQAAGSVSAVHQALNKVTTDFDPLFTRAIEQANTAQKRYEQLRSDFDTTTSSNLDRMREIGILFDERLTTLKNGAEQAAHILKISGEDMQGRVAEIETASRSASEKMHDIQQSLDNQSSDIHLITDQALLKIEAVQNAINTQFHELSELVAHSLTRMDDAIAEVGKSVAVVENTADRAVVRFRETGDLAYDQSQRLNESSATTAQATSTLVSRIQAESETLLLSSRETLAELKRMSEALTEQVGEMAEQMRSSLQTSQAYGSELRDQASVVADSSAVSADRISRAVIELRGQMDDVGKGAGDALANIEKSRGLLSSESERLGTVSATAIRAAEDVAAVFGRQSNALFKAVQEAAQHVDDIRKIEGRTQRESFLSSAKFIVESLHSLSVDITRIMDREIPEKTWKAFQKGDVGAFTRRLAQLGSELKMDRLRDKFATDTEFRTYVQRFIRQFEDIFDQAAANDHGELLSSVFVSSDIGRLYGILCDVSGREAKFNKGEKKVA